MAAKKKEATATGPTPEQIAKATNEIRQCLIGLNGLMSVFPPGLNPTGLHEVGRKLKLAQHFLAGEPESPPPTKLKPRVSALELEEKELAAKKAAEAKG